MRLAGGVRMVVSGNEVGLTSSSVPNIASPVARVVSMFARSVAVRSQWLGSVPKPRAIKRKIRMMVRSINVDPVFVLLFLI